MKNKGIIVGIMFLVVLIVVLVSIDFSSTRVDKRPDNPYKYETDHLKRVPENLIRYQETRQFRLNADSLKSIAYHDAKIFLIADDFVSIIHHKGNVLKRIRLEDEARCIHIPDASMLIVGYKNYFSIYDHQGEPLIHSTRLNEKALITSLAKIGDKIFLADAGNRRVAVFNIEGEKLFDFEGISGSSSLHGFIIPSACFDLAVNQNKELWVVNPGMHALQHYSENGNLENYWDKPSMKIEGFSGCCNPAHFTFLPNGNFVTSEKGLVRIKEYSPQGELLSVAAPPSKFTDEGQAPDVVCDEQGNIIALDYDKKLIRFFEPDVNTN